MKFAKELEQELVPEWRAKYLDYKTGKKKDKAITKAIQKGNRGPQTPSFRSPTPSFYESPILERSNTKKHSDGAEEDDASNHNAIRRGSSPLPIPRSRSTPRPERQPLRNQGSRLPDTVGSYGSIIVTPPNSGMMGSDRASFELPDPLMDPNEEYVPPGQDPGYQKEVRTPSPVARRATFSAPAQPMEDRTMIPRTPTVPTLHSASTHGTTLTPTNSRNRTSQLLRRVWSNADGEGAGKRAAVDLALEAQKRQDEFFEFLDAELHKIDSFYRMKEEEATVRLKVLRQQLHIMRDQRIQEVYEVKRAAKILKDEHPDQ